MTSKAAIKLVKNVYQDDLERVPSNTCLKLIIEGLEQAEKDLEILEILRKHLTTIQITGLGTEKYKDIVVIPYEDEKDAERVRKWLERED